MSSWWRKYCEAHNIPGTTGSWKKAAATFYSYNAPAMAASWPKVCANIVSTAGSPGLGTGESWTKRLIDEDNQVQSGSAAKMLTISGGRPPMD